MNAKQKYLKKYKQKPEVKEKHAQLMKERYDSPEGRAYDEKKRKTPRSRYTRGKYNAAKRKKVFTLTFEEYEQLICQPCAYCNQSIADETGVGLDRKDNDLGYITGNVNPCCSKCNRIRAKSMSAEEFERQTILNERRK